MCVYPILFVLLCLDVDLVSGKACGKTRVLSLLADSERKLLGIDNYTCRTVVLYYNITYGGGRKSGGNIFRRLSRV